MTDSRSTDPTPREIAALRRWLDQQPVGPEPDAMELAAWLEGHRDEAASARVEDWLAREPIRLEALLSSGEGARETVPEAEISRAQALVAGPARRRSASSWPVRLAGGGLVLAGAGGGLAVGLALAQWQTVLEGLQMMALFADFGGLPGGVVMRWLKWALAASLLFNCLALAGYFYARHLGPGDGSMVRALELTPAQENELRALRQEARQHFRATRARIAPQTDALARAMREARPGNDRIEPALRQLAEARIPSQVHLARRIVAFRDSLDPRQQETFNRMLGRPGFALGLLGLSRVGQKAGFKNAAPPEPVSLSNPSNP